MSEEIKQAELEHLERTVFGKVQDDRPRLADRLNRVAELVGNRECNTVAQAWMALEALLIQRIFPMTLMLGSAQTSAIFQALRSQIDAGTAPVLSLAFALGRLGAELGAPVSGFTACDLDTFGHQLTALSNALAALGDPVRKNPPPPLWSQAVRLAQHFGVDTNDLPLFEIVRAVAATSPSHEIWQEYFAVDPRWIPGRDVLPLAATLDLDPDSAPQVFLAKLGSSVQLSGNEDATVASWLVRQKCYELADAIAKIEYRLDGRINDAEPSLCARLARLFEATDGVPPEFDELSLAELQRRVAEAIDRSTTLDPDF